MHARPLKYLDTLVYIEHMHHALVHASCMLDVMSLGFALYTNHIIMMSLAFVFHLCHVGIRWHGIIGVCNA